MADRPYIVGIGGTTRAGSTSERALGVALAFAKTQGCDTRLFGAAELPGETYDPTRSERSTQAAALVAELRRADGVVIATPSYHGGISGLIKNAIDFVEDMRDDERPYLDGRSVGCIVVAEGPQAIGATLMALRAVVHALRGWPTPYGAALNPRSALFGDPNAQPDPAAVRACEIVGREVVSFARMARALRAATAAA
jgi:FMN reductase